MFNRLRRIDQFGQKPAFLINGKSTYKTVFGAILTLLMATILVIYGFKKFTGSIAEGDFKSSKIMPEGEMPEKDKFGDRNDDELYLQLSSDVAYYKL